MVLTKKDRNITSGTSLGGYILLIILFTSQRFYEKIFFDMSHVDTVIFCNENKDFF